MRLSRKVEIQPTPTQRQALLQHAGNAAINILVAGSCPETKNACGAGVRRDGLTIVPQPAMKQESAWS